MASPDNTLFHWGRRLLSAVVGVPKAQGSCGRWHKCLLVSGLDSLGQRAYAFHLVHVWFEVLFLFVNLT